MIVVAIRWILELALLIVAWRHSHWSVALCLTLQGLSIETSGLIQAVKAHRHQAIMRAAIAKATGQQETEQKKFWQSFEPK